MSVFFACCMILSTVADVRDGGLSGSTLKEACSWGKVNSGLEQMVYCEATLAVPLIVGYAYHKHAWKEQVAQRLSHLFHPITVWQLRDGK